MVQPPLLTGVLMKKCDEILDKSEFVAYFVAIPLPLDAGLEEEDVEDFRHSNGGGCIPDTGSILTHGSTVVLAGNMGAAMRQRKKQTESQQQDHRTFDFDGGIKSDVSKFTKYNGQSILVENSNSSSFSEDRNFDDIAVSGVDDTDNQSTGGINTSFKHHLEIGEEEFKEDFSPVQPKPDISTRRLIRRDGRTSRPEDGALGTNHFKLSEKNSVARKNISAAVSKRKDDHPTPTYGNTSNKWTGKMPSASFKIEVLSNPLTDFRTQATIKRTPQRGRGAVFGNLSLPCELVNKSSIAKFGIGKGVYSEDDIDPISDMNRDFAQRFGDKMNGIHAPRSAVHRDSVQSNCKTQNVEDSDNVIESLTGDSYLEDIDSDNSDCESWDALPAHEAVSHSTRHLLMSASSRKRPQSSPALGPVSWRPQSDGGHAPTIQHMSRESKTLFAASNLLNRWTVSTDVSSELQASATSNNEKLHGKGKGTGQELTTLASRVTSCFSISLSYSTQYPRLIV